jgi:hypothetical protein
MESLFSPESVFARVQSRLSVVDLQLVLPRDDHMLDEPSVPAALSTGMQKGCGPRRLGRLSRRSQGHSHAKDDRLGLFRTDRHSWRQDRGAGQEPAATTLWEAREEIGLDAGHVEPLGYPDPYPTGPGFSIVPVVAKAAAPVAIKINPDTLIEAFEVPFAFIINAANHALRHKQLDGKTRHFHAMPYGTLNILSVTAGILRNLYERLYS